MKRVSVLLLVLGVVALAMLAVAVDAAASDKITLLKARVESESAAAMAASVGAAPAAARKVAVAKGAKAAQAKRALPTFKLPVKMEGIAPQMPGDKENNEKLISKANGDIAINKAKIIKEQVLKDSYAAVAAADVSKQNFQDLQAEVLREPLIPA